MAQPPPIVSRKARTTGETAPTAAQHRAKGYVVPVAVVDADIPLAVVSDSPLPHGQIHYVT